MRQTAQKAGVSLGAVSNVIDEAKKSSRIVYVYMDRKKPATLLDIYPAINRLEIWRGNPRPFNDRDESAACFYHTINLPKV